MAFKGWNYGDLAEAVEAALDPAHPVLVHGERVITRADFARRTNNLARTFLAGGAKPGEKVAIYTRNHPAYLESLFAAFKARLVHVNINYRYIAEVIAELPFNGYVSHEWRPAPGRDPMRSIEEAFNIMDV